MCELNASEGRALERCPKTCLEFPKPVCGTDGQIYLNECQMRQMNCDSDGKVYLNHCKMLYENCETGIKRMPLRFCVGDDEQKL
ncbi:unnamed protein product [Oppiella nova]|uniref:Kazal-like domain-containing protein n=1 Tax=Oppiella nova TaxID=334625 RepID=A0A7R9QQZ9_9ACAR|nr:unnamed protein product [Oppiella nova]CAG2170611.1 unnamed protein product [Oppiella nova]